MSPSKSSANKVSSRTILPRLNQYVLIPRLHPNGWKLLIQDATEHLLFEVFRRPTTPLRYQVQPAPTQKGESLVIKSLNIGEITRYTLYQGTQEILSIRFASESKKVFLRNPARQTIAQFIILSSKVTLLQTENRMVARLRFRDHPSPSGFLVKCEIADESRWLYAIIVFTVAQIETQSHPSPPHDFAKSTLKRPSAHSDAETT